MILQVRVLCDMRRTYVTFVNQSVTIFQELKNAIHSRKEMTNWAILYSVSNQAPIISNVVSKISSFSLIERYHTSLQIVAF